MQPLLACECCAWPPSLAPRATNRLKCDPRMSSRCVNSIGVGAFFPFFEAWSTAQALRSGDFECAVALATRAPFGAEDEVGLEFRAIETSLRKVKEALKRGASGDGLRFRTRCVGSARENEFVVEGPTFVEKEAISVWQAAVRSRRRTSGRSRASSSSSRSSKKKWSRLFCVQKKRSREATRGDARRERKPDRSASVSYRAPESPRFRSHRALSLSLGRRFAHKIDAPRPSRFSVATVTTVL